jgi:hypothetical protein
MSEVIEAPEVAPKALRVARVILYIQAVASLLGAVVQLLEVVSRVQHGQDVSGLAYYGAVANPLVGVLLLVSAALVVSGRTWVRPLALVLEAIAILNGVLNVIFGFPQAVAAILIAIGVITLLSRAEVGDWIERRNSEV